MSAAGCVGKQKHDRATANMLARKSKHPDILAYACPACGGWHIGNRSSRMNSLKRTR